MKISPCNNCGGGNLYRSGSVSAGGGYAPNYLPGLGNFWSAETFQLVVCRDCGLTQYFASPEAVEKLPNSGKWERVQPV